MFRKVNNRFLITVFFILLIFVVVVFFFDSGKNERTFRDVLVNIDTTAVTEIQIISKANNNQPLKIFNLDMIQGRILYSFILPALALILTW